MSTPTVTIAQGTLSGKVLVNENGKEYHGFCGIPYAAAPVGKLRFRVKNYKIYLILNINSLIKYIR